MKRFSLILLLALWASSQLSAQTFKAYLRAAENAYAQGDYYNAMYYFGIAHEVDDKDPEILLKLAESAYLFNSFSMADSAYTKLIDTGWETQFPDLRYQLAMTKKSLGQYQLAEELFFEYAGKAAGVNDSLAQRAVEEAQSCEWAREQLANPNKKFDIYSADSIGGHINTQHSEFGTYAMDETLYYTSFRFGSPLEEERPVRPYMKLLAATGDGPGELMDKLNDDSLHTAYLSYNREQTRIYYALCLYVNLAEVSCELYSRPVIAPDSFGAAVKLPAPINLPGFNNSQPNVGFDAATGRELLFFVSDREGGKGKTDIWYAELDPDGSCGAPKNVPGVNTLEEEGTPFFHESSQTLYFSSKGRRNMGGFDIFGAEWTGQGCNEPQNLGHPVNSSLNDIYFIVDDSQTAGYLSSNREKAIHYEDNSDYCCYDIYRFERLVQKLDFYAYNGCLSLQDQLLTGIYFEVFEWGEEGPIPLASGTSTEEEGFSYTAQYGKKYLVKASKDGYLPALDTIDLIAPPAGDISQRRLYLPPKMINLYAKVFDKKDKVPLDDVTVQLFEYSDQIAMESNTISNDFTLQLERDKKYYLIFSKPGYHTDTIQVNLDLIGDDCQIPLSVNMLKKKLIEIPPLSLYFDNGEPERKSYQRTTKLSYGDTYEAYVAKKEEYISKFTQVLEGRNRFLAEQRIKAFFEREVKEGYESLIVFTERMYEYLEEGIPIEVTISGFSSPRASNRYNELLSARRINSLLNHFYSYKGGVLKPYIRSKMLIITEVSLGEEKVPEEVREKLLSERESIYSPIAARERRVEILGVTINKENQ